MFKRLGNNYLNFERILSRNAKTFLSEGSNKLSLQKNSGMIKTIWC